jgi:diguanylate cyclase (GGDEF)-like protein
VRDKLATTARENALLELSAKFDDERRARQIELLQRDNTIKSRGLQVQQLRQEMIVVITSMIVLICGALSWGILRIRKINAHLLQNTKHDGLTGLLNRGYFNERTLTRQANRPYVGCLLFVGVDSLEHINEAVGYCAADEVLRIVSERLSSTMYDSDALVRWASETFLVMTGPMSDAELNLAVRRLLTAINTEPATANDAGAGCTVSIGYASFPLNGAAVDISLDGAITLVSKALRHARRQGGDRACLISLVNANSARELSAITTQFEVAASDRRVQLVETQSASRSPIQNPTPRTV